MIEDDETMSSFDSHEAQTCGGIWAACSFCDAEDLLRAQAIKAETRRLAIRKPDYSSVATESAE